MIKVDVKYCSVPTPGCGVLTAARNIQLGIIQLEPKQSSSFPYPWCRLPFRRHQTSEWLLHEHPSKTDCPRRWPHSCRAAYYKPRHHDSLTNAKKLRSLHGRKELWGESLSVVKNTNVSLWSSSRGHRYRISSVSWSEGMRYFAVFRKWVKDQGLPQIAPLPRMFFFFLSNYCNNWFFFLLSPTSLF